MHERLRALKDEFFGLVHTQLRYFGVGAGRMQELAVPEKTKFERTLCKRLAVAGILVRELRNDPNFGRTKLAKLFYLADVHEHLDLQTDYYREAAGPLDQRALYNERFGIEALAQKYHLFHTESKGKMVRYKPLSDFDKIGRFAAKHLGDAGTRITTLAGTFGEFTTDQSEIVATLYACWNDFLIQKREPTDDEIISEFLLHWHMKKARFSRARLRKALDWMRKNGLVPKGSGRLTSSKMAT